MSHYCTVCGRELTKTDGPIGPKCLQKMRPRNRRRHRSRTGGHIGHSYDLYGGTHGQEKDERASEGTEDEKAGQNGSGG